MASQRGRVLIIAGSDSGGGAGIQADIKTVTALGGYASTAITALTVQNTLGVSSVHPVPVEFVIDQATAVLNDIGADVIKTGMLGSAELVDAVIELSKAYPDIPLIVDPVMVATSGDMLVSNEAIEAIRTGLLPQAYLITPNVPEAEKLTGLEVTNATQQEQAGQALLQAGAHAALVKGGHLPGNFIHDVLVEAKVTRLLETERINSRNTHGTGCTLASGIATGLAKGLDLPRAIEVAGSYLSEAIRRAPGFGVGHGPVNHAWVVDR